MPEPSELEKQSQALSKFEKSVGHPVAELRWPYSKTMPEPVEHHIWRLYATTAYRFDLFYDAGLVTDIDRPFYDKLFREASELESATWHRWCKRKAKLEMDLFTGKRKSLPWSC